MFLKNRTAQMICQTNKFKCAYKKLGCALCLTFLIAMYSKNTPHGL